MSYNKTTWINDVTPLNDRNLNNIEKGIYDLSVSTKYLNDSIDTMNKTILSLIQSNDGKVDTSTLNALKLELATISELNSVKANINTLVSDNANIKELVSNKASIESLNATNASVLALSAETAKVTELVANKATIDQLKAVSADIQLLHATSATIEELTTVTAKINEIFADYVTTSVLEAAVANIETLTTDLATIKDLVSGNITSVNILAGGITSDSLTIKDAFIKDAMIDSISASKLKAGSIDTTVINIVSKDGNLKIYDNTIQIKDNNDKVRVQIGKDAKDDYSLSVWDNDGKIMFDARGLKSDALKDAIIRDDMISDEANISGSKLNINSVISKINDDGTSTIKSSKVFLDDVEQTLDVSFSSMKSSVNEAVSSSASALASLKVANGKIDTLISNNSIEKDGVTTTLKDEFLSTQQKVNGIAITIKDNTAKIDTNSGEISSAVSRVNEMENKVDKFSIRISDVETTSNKLSQNVSNMNDKINKTVKSVNVYYYLSSSSTQLIGGSWQLTSPTWVEGKYIWSKTVTVMTDDTTSESNPSCITGTKGDKGDTGTTGTGISSITQQYYLSTSKTELVNGTWTSTPPTWVSGKYIWTRSEIVYKNPKSTEYTTPICDSSWEAVSEVEKNMNKKIADLDVSLEGITSTVSDIKTKYLSSNMWLVKKYNKNLGNVTIPVIDDLSGLTPYEQYELNDTNNLISATTSSTTENKIYSFSTNLYTSSNKTITVNATCEGSSNFILNNKQIGTVSNTTKKINLQLSKGWNPIVILYYKYSNKEKLVFSEAIKLSVDNMSYTQTDSLTQAKINSAEQKITTEAIINTVKNSETNGEKTFAQTSDLTQTSNSIIASFKESGGQNLIRNSTGLGGTSCWSCDAGSKLGISVSNLTGSANSRYLYLNNGTNTVTKSAYSSRFKLKPSSKYTFVGYFHNNTKCPSFSVYVLSSTSLNESDTTLAYTATNELILKQNTGGAWNKFSATFVTPASTRSGYLRIDNNGYNASGSGDNNIHWNSLILIEGGLESPWSCHPSESYDGIVKIDKNGLEVTSSNIDTITKIAPGQFSISKGTEDLFKVDKDGLSLKGKMTILGASTIGSNNTTVDDFVKNTNNTNSTVDDNASKWGNAYDRVNQWSSGNPANSTTINGGCIATNSVTADKLNVKGLTVTSDAGVRTLDISKKGEISIDAKSLSLTINGVKQEASKAIENVKADLTKVELRFKAGTNNLLNNGCIKGNINKDPWTLSSGLTWHTGSGGRYGILQSSTDELYLYSEVIDVSKLSSRVVSLSVNSCVEKNVLGGEAFILGYNDSGSMIWAPKIDLSYNTWGISTLENQTIPTNVEKIQIRVDHNGCRTGANGNYVVVYIDWINLVEGAIPYIDGPLKSNAFAEGVTTVDADGIKVKHNQSSTYTQIDSEGLEIYSNNNVPIASFGRGNKAIIDTVEATTINSKTVIPQLRDKGVLHCYVAVIQTGDGSGRDQSNRCNSVTTAIRNVFSRFGVDWTPSSGAILSNTSIVVHVWWGGTITEFVTIRDFLGEGELQIDFGYDMEVLAEWKFINCNNLVIDGEKTSHDHNDGARFRRLSNSNFDSLTLIGCKHVNIANCRFYSENSSWSAITMSHGTNAKIAYCDFYGGTHSLYVTYNSTCCSYLNRGSGTRSVFLMIVHGGIAIWERAIGTGGAASNTGGWGTSTTGEGQQPWGQASCQVAPPAVTNKQLVQDFVPNSYKSTRSYNTETGTLKQGCWDTGKGNFTGYMDFGSSIKDWLSNSVGGVTAQIYLQRASTTHGNSGAVPCYINGTSVGSFTRGQAKWVTVPTTVINNLKNGSTTSVTVTGSGRSQYIVYNTNAVLRVTATKPV